MADQDPLVENQISQPGEVPQTQMLTGFLAESSQPGHTRVLLDPTGNRYVDIPTEDVVHTQSLEGEMTGSAVFVKQNAHLVYSQSRAMPVSEFLQGSITGAFLPGAGAAPQAAARCLAFTAGESPVVSQACSDLQCQSRFVCVTIECGGSDIC